MGLRSTTATLTVSSTNAAAMAPALTEPISQAKISSPTAAASPRPEILVVTNVNQEYLCTFKQTSGGGGGVDCDIGSIDCDSVGDNCVITKTVFEQTTFGENQSNGPGSGPPVLSHMDQSSNDPTDFNDQDQKEQIQHQYQPQDQHSQQGHHAQHPEEEENLTNIGEFVEISEPPTELIMTNSSSVAEQQNNNGHQQQQQPPQPQTPPSTSNNMGLQKDYLKDSAEMEQMLGDLASSGEIDLMQVFKSFESVPASDNLCELAGGLSLFNDVDVMNMGLEYVTTPNKDDTETLDIRNEIEKRQAQMMRKCDFLIRRLRKVQARYMGQHINEEVNSLFDYVQQLVKRKERGCKTISTMAPINVLCGDHQKQPQSCSMKNLIKRLDNVATTNQQLTSQKNKVGRPSKAAMAAAAAAAAAASMSTKTDVLLSPMSNNCLAGGKEASNVLQAASTNSAVVPDFDVDSHQELETSSGLLQAAIKKISYAIDSDATASSSGGESADEMIAYNNSTQNSLTIAKRAAWRWARDRAAIAAKCSWLLSQISDLEYRVRQHTELHHQIKKNKGDIQFEDGGNNSSDLSMTGQNQQQQPPPQNSVNGYRGILPGNLKSNDMDILSPNGAFDVESTWYGSCRTRAFQKSSFKKRKLTQMTNLHTISKKAAKSSTVKCGCQWPLHPCALCTGRTDPTAPRELIDTLSFRERVALLDPGFHPVVSFVEDVSQSIHFESTMRRAEWQLKASRLNAKSVLKGALALQKQIERESGGDGTKHLYESNLPKKYQKKYNILASSKLKKKARKNKSNRHSHLLHSNKHRKKSLNSTTSDLETMSGEGDVTMTANGVLLPRSKTSSPTPCSSKHEKFAYFSDRKNKNSYDIDNIVIPYSVAASTRIEILQCKEIPTPKWRIIDEENEQETECPDSESNEHSNDKKEMEDVTLDTIFARHERALAEERKKFSTYLKFPWSTRSRANRRIDSRAESSGANTPDRTSPSPKTPSVSGDHESIPSPAVPSLAVPSPAVPSTAVPSPAVPSPAAPSKPQTPLEHNDAAAESTTNNITATTVSTPLITSTPTKAISGPVSSNNSSGIIPISALKFERRRTVSLRKALDTRDDGSRSNHHTADTREFIQPFESLEFPLPADLYESMLKLYPSLQSTLDEFSQNMNNNVAGISTLTTSTKTLDGGNSGTTSVNNSISKMDNNHLMYMNESAYAMDDSEETDSVESGMIDEDPNDPEWCEPPSRT